VIFRPDLRSDPLRIWTTRQMINRRDARMRILAPCPMALGNAQRRLGVDLRTPTRRRAPRRTSALYDRVGALEAHRPRSPTRTLKAWAAA
jgi:hypothetical protein